MADYNYIVIDAHGKERKGTIKSDDELKVHQKLKGEGYIVVSVKEAGVLTRELNVSFGNAVKPRDIGIFCRQFNSILAAGVTVVEALQMMSEQTENKAFAKAIKEACATVEKGDSLANAFRQNKKIFPPLMINLVEAGEASGGLDVAFARLATHFEKTAKINGLVKKAMVYPVVLIFVAFAVLIIMSVAVIPKFAKMFVDMGTEMPLVTVMVMKFSDFLIKRWYLAIGIVVLLVVLLKVFKDTEQGKVVFGKLSIKVPIFGKLTVKNASASMARTLSTLIGSGLSISTSIEITARTMKNVLYRRALEKAKQEVEQGVSLSEPLRACGLFPPMVHHMVKIGEETGGIEAMLDKVAEYYEEEVELTTQGLTAAMEPLIIVVMAVIVGILVMAIYMPMISMYSGMENL